MKSILIINLRRLGDVISSTHLVNSYLAKYPGVDIHLLTYKESEVAANLINGVSAVHIIDRARIIILNNNRMFPDSLAIEELFNPLNHLKQTEWDLVVNFSNDTVSTNLTSYFSIFSKKTVYVGLRFSCENTATPSNMWSAVFNDVLTTYKHTPITFNTCYHKMTDIEATTNRTLLKTNEEYDRVAFKNLNRIKEIEARKGTDIKIVGIQLKASSASKELSQDTVKELIAVMLDDPSLFPVLLIAPFENEREFAAYINSCFDNSLIVIEADLSAVVSVLSNIDLLITPDTVVKHIADSVGLPLVEISLGEGPFLKQGTITSGNLIVSPAVNYRSWYNKKMAIPGEYNHLVKANDIFMAVKCLLEPQRTKFAKFSENISVYAVERDALGIWVKNVAGAKDTHHEISRIVSRQYLISYFNLENESNISRELSEHSPKIFGDWLSLEKQSIVAITRDLLSAIRSLRMLESRNEKIQHFIESVDNLFSHCDSQRLVAIPLLLFRAKVEALGKLNSKANMSQFENLLFTLKKDIQLVVTCLNRVDQHLSAAKSKEYTNKTFKPSPEAGEVV